MKGERKVRQEQDCYFAGRFATMDAPPSYDESTKATISAFPLSESSSSKKGQDVRRWHLQEELSASRAEHVTAAVNKVQAVLEDRVRVGISTTTLVLVPYGQTVPSE